MHTAPNIKSIVDTFRFDEETAKRIRHAWKEATKSELIRFLGPKLHHGFVDSRNYAAMLAINGIGEFYGVEYLGKNRNGFDVDFLNSGDTYSPTFIFVGNRLFIATVGDLIESNYIKKLTF